MDGKLDTLLKRLGPEFRDTGTTEGPIPLITLEQFFDGPVDDAAVPGGDTTAARQVFLAIRAREDVADIRLGIIDWPGDGRWPRAGYLYLSTDAEPEQVAGWLNDAGLPFRSSGTGEGPRPREPMRLPEGMQCVWFRFA